MSKEAIALLEKPLGFKPEDAPSEEEVIAALEYKIMKALALLKQPKALDFAINCGAMGKGDDSCCGCIVWSADGKLICNECGTEYFLIEQQPPAGEWTEHWRYRLNNAVTLFKMGKNPDEWFQDIVTGFREACDIIDTAEALNKDLLDALEKYGEHEPGCMLGDACNCGFRAVIAKYQKEKKHGGCRPEG